MGEVGEEVENKMQNDRRLMESRLKQKKLGYKIFFDYISMHKFWKFVIFQFFCSLFRISFKLYDY
jgi:hypothetical protein